MKTLTKTLIIAYVAILLVIILIAIIQGNVLIFWFGLFATGWLFVPSITLSIDPKHKF